MKYPKTFLRTSTPYVVKVNGQSCKFDWDEEKQGRMDGC